MPKVRGNKSKAAQRREASERGVIVPPSPSFLEATSDPTYVDNPCEEFEIVPLELPLKPDVMSGSEPSEL